MMLISGISLGIMVISEMVMIDRSLGIMVVIRDKSLETIVISDRTLGIMVICDKSLGMMVIRGMLFK